MRVPTAVHVAARATPYGRDARCPDGASDAFAHRKPGYSPAPELHIDFDRHAYLRLSEDIPLRE